MDLNSMLLGGPEGVVGQARRMGTQERDRQERHKADLMELIERVKKMQAEEQRAGAIHPLEMERRQLANRTAATGANKAEFDFGLDQMYGARQRRANVEQTEQSTQTQRENSGRARGVEFLNSLGQLAQAGEITDEDLERSGAILGDGYQTHPLYGMLKRMTPEQRKMAVPKAQQGTTATQGEMAKQKAMTDRAAMQERERTNRAEKIAAAREAGRMAAAAAKAKTDPKTWFQKLEKLEQQYNAATDPVEKARIAGEFEKWQEIMGNQRPEQSGFNIVPGADGARPTITPKPARPRPIPITGRGGAQHSLTPMVPPRTAPEVLYARNAEGVRIMSTDGGQTWTEVDDQ